MRKHSHVYPHRRVTSKRLVAKGQRKEPWQFPFFTFHHANEICSADRICLFSAGLGAIEAACTDAFRHQSTEKTSSPRRSICSGDFFWKRYKNDEERKAPYTASAGSDLILPHAPALLCTGARSPYATRDLGLGTVVEIFEPVFCKCPLRSSAQTRTFY